MLVRLDQFIYDARLRAAMPGTLDPRIVIVDIDEPSLQQLGQWPWSRDKLARLTDELMGRQQAAVLGFAVLFAEADTSSGLPVLRQLAAGPWHDDPTFAAEIERLAPRLDHDALFAKALAGRRVALGYYFTQTSEARATGAAGAGAAVRGLSAGTRGRRALERLRRQHPAACERRAGGRLLQCRARPARGLGRALGAAARAQRGRGGAPGLL